MRETIQIRIETLRNYARPGRLTCPLVGIPLVEVGRTIVVRRELLQAALSAPGMEPRESTVCDLSFRTRRIAAATGRPH